MTDTEIEIRKFMLCLSILHQRTTRLDNELKHLIREELVFTHLAAETKPVTFSLDAPDTMHGVADFRPKAILCVSEDGQENQGCAVMEASVSWSRPGLPIPEKRPDSLGFLERGPWCGNPFWFASFLSSFCSSGQVLRLECIAGG